PEAVAGHIHREQSAVADLEPAVDIDQCRENQYIPEQLVQERRVEDTHQLTCRHTVQRVESAAGIPPLIHFQAPRQGRRAPVQLLVEVIAQPANGLRQNDSRRDRVTERRQRNALLPAPDPRSDAAQGHRAPNAEAAAPEPTRPPHPRRASSRLPSPPPPPPAPPRRR